MSVGDFTPPFVKMMPAKVLLHNPKLNSCLTDLILQIFQGIVKRNSQQGNRDSNMGQQQPPPRREIKLMNSMVRQERPEDPNVWKPKHATKSKEEKENPEKASSEVRTNLLV